MPLRQRWFIFPVFAVLCGAAQHSLAAGFALQEANAAGLGHAYAGAAAVAEDASTVYFNPAGMHRLRPGHHVSAAASVLRRDLSFSDGGSSPIAGGVPTGTDGGNAGSTVLIPAGYYSSRLSADWRFGIGVSAPFGNETRWNRHFIGRYQGTRSQIRALNLNPSLSWRASEHLSLGLGINYMDFHAQLDSQAPLIAGGQYAGDSRVRLRGDDRAWGYNLGLLYQWRDDTRIGLSYRSRMDLTAKGSVRSATGREPASVDITLPDTLSLAVAHEPNARWQLLADITWTGWDRIEALVVEDRFGNALSRERLDFDNSWRAGLGASYRLDERWTLRMGTAYDRSPVRDADSRSVRLPDSDRIWLALGAQWQLGPRSSVDLGYARLFFRDARIERATPGSAQVVQGRFSTRADLVALQFNHRFD